MVIIVDVAIRRSAFIQLYSMCWLQLFIMLLLLLLLLIFTCCF